MGPCVGVCAHCNYIQSVSFLVQGSCTFLPCTLNFAVVWSHTMKRPNDDQDVEMECAARSRGNASLDTVACGKWSCSVCGATHTSNSYRSQCQLHGGLYIAIKVFSSKPLGSFGLSLESFVFRKFCLQEVLSLGRFRKFCLQEVLSLGKFRQFCLQEVLVLKKRLPHRLCLYTGCSSGVLAACGMAGSPAMIGMASQSSMLLERTCRSMVGFFLLCGVCCVTLNMAIHAMTFQIPPSMPAALCALLAWRQT